MSEVQMFQDTTPVKFSSGPRKRIWREGKKRRYTRNQQETPEWISNDQGCSPLLTSTPYRIKSDNFRLEEDICTKRVKELSISSSISEDITDKSDDAVYSSPLSAKLFNDEDFPSLDDSAFFSDPTWNTKSTDDDKCWGDIMDEEEIKKTSKTPEGTESTLARKIPVKKSKLNGTRRRLHLSELTSIENNIECKPEKSDFKGIKRSLSGTPRERENDEKILTRRQKQIDYGKNTLGYDRYTKAVAREKRNKEHPRTPDKNAKVSRRSFDMQIKIWRRRLHEFDPPDVKKDWNEQKSDELFLGIPLDSNGDIISTDGDTLDLTDCNSSAEDQDAFQTDLKDLDNVFNDFDSIDAIKATEMI